MGLEAITAVEQAEAAAARKKAEAAQQAKRLATIADGEGRQALEDAGKRVEARLRELDEQADDRIRTEAERIREETARELDALRAGAELRLDQAADRIAERIVNG